MLKEVAKLGLIDNGYVKLFPNRNGWESDAIEWANKHQAILGKYYKQMTKHGVVIVSYTVKAKENE